MGGAIRREEGEGNNPWNDRERHEPERPLKAVKFHSEDLRITPGLREKIVRVIALTQFREIIDKFLLTQFRDLAEIDQRPLAAFEIRSAPEVEEDEAHCNAHERDYTRDRHTNGKRMDRGRIPSKVCHHAGIDREDNGRAGFDPREEPKDEIQFIFCSVYEPFVFQAAIA